MFGADARGWGWRLVICLRSIFDGSLRKRQNETEISESYREASHRWGARRLLILRQLQRSAQRICWVTKVDSDIHRAIHAKSYSQQHHLKFTPSLRIFQSIQVLNWLLHLIFERVSHFSNDLGRVAPCVELKVAQELNYADVFTRSSDPSIIEKDNYQYEKKTIDQTSHRDRRSAAWNEDLNGSEWRQVSREISYVDELCNS